MAYHGEWGVQNHMPFTGGTYLHRNLRKLDRGVLLGSMHDLAVSEWRYEREFMTIRQIPEWYRSAHGYMSPKWRCGGTDSGMWNIISARLVHCKDDDFNKFMHNVFHTYPGLCSWAYYMYYVPGSELIHIDTMDNWLKANWDIEGADDPKHPRNPHNSHKDKNVVITDQIRAMCKNMEDRFWWKLTRSR